MLIAVIEISRSMETIKAAVQLNAGRYAHYKLISCNYYFNYNCAIKC